MGFNNNVKCQDQVFHVQTEDSGLDAPHIITHLFADGGRVIKSHKRLLRDVSCRADVAGYVRSLMKAQHMEMVLALREGRFDGVIAGREIGGISLLTEPPNVDAVRKLASKKQEAGRSRASRRARLPEASAPVGACVRPLRRRRQCLGAHPARPRRAISVFTFCAASPEAPSATSPRGTTP